MPSQKNISQVKLLTDKLSGSKAVILADYSGLSVSKQAELRRKIKESGGEFIVTKNRLFKLALLETAKSGLQRGLEETLPGLPRELEENLRGPTAFLFAFEDEIAPLKTLIQFSEIHELPKTKIGLILKPEDRVLTVEEIERLARLPAREELIARLVAALNAPQARLVNSLSGNLTKLVLIIKEIQKSKEIN